jgi:hypothetical protein
MFVVMNEKHVYFGNNIIFIIEQFVNCLTS